MMAWNLSTYLIQDRRNIIGYPRQPRVYDDGAAVAVVDDVAVEDPPRNSRDTQVRHYIDYQPHDDRLYVPEIPRAETVAGH